MVVAAACPHLTSITLMLTRALRILLALLQIRESPERVNHLAEVTHLKMKESRIKCSSVEVPKTGFMTLSCL